MPEKTVPAPALTPSWAVESKPFGDSHVHESKVYEWGTASLHIERLDTPTTEGTAYVIATTPTAENPIGEVIAFEYATVFELWKMLDDLIKDTETIDVFKEYIKRLDRLKADADTTADNNSQRLIP